MKLLTPDKKIFTLDDRRRLNQVIAEIQARSLEIPEDIAQEIEDGEEEIIWEFDSNGYSFKQDKTRFIPNEYQKEFIESDAQFSALISGRGGGKSASGAQKALKKLNQGLSGAVLNPDFENFKISTWEEFRQWIPWEHVVPKHQYRKEPEWFPNQPFTLVFDNGASVICKGLKDEDSARGPNINWLWYDEAGRDLTGGAWQIAIASVRVGNNPQAWITTTPKGKDHWIYRFFVTQEDIDEEAKKIFAELSDAELIHYVFTSLDDNKDNVDPLFYARLLAAYPPGWLREQELNGEFVDQGGVLGDRSWFNGRIIPYAPDIIIKRIRYWDLAASEKKVASGKKINDPDETTGTLGSFNREEVNGKNVNKFYIEDQVGGYWEWEDILKNIKTTAIRDGPSVPIYVEQEPASGGKNQVAAIDKYIREELPGWQEVKGHNPREIGDKIMRANTWFAEAAKGLIYLVQGTWNDPFLNQLASFPLVRHDDKIDGVSGVRHVLAPVKMWRDIPFMSL